MSKKNEVKTTPVDPETLDKIADIINIAECCKYSYFWRDNGNCSSRRHTEREYNRDPVCWTDGDDEYSAEYKFSQSRKHTYARGIYYRNGVRTTLTAIRNSYNRLVAASKNNE